MELNFKNEVYGSDMDLINAVLCTVQYSLPSDDGNYYLSFTEEGWNDFEKPYPTQRKALLNHALKTLRWTTIGDKELTKGVVGAFDKCIVQIPDTEELKTYLKDKDLSEFIEESKFITNEA